MFAAKFLAGIALGFILIIMSGGIHKIKEGHVGIYTRGGALLAGQTHSGFNLMIPGITTCHQIQFTI